MDYKKIIDFFEKDLWRISEGDVSPVRFLFLELLKKVVLAIRFFTAKRVLQKAAALTYSTLLAIVPIMAVVFAIARGFGYSRFIEVWFRQAFESQPQAAEVQARDLRIEGDAAKKNGQSSRPVPVGQNGAAGQRGRQRLIPPAENTPIIFESLIRYGEDVEIGIVPAQHIQNLVHQRMPPLSK